MAKVNLLKPNPKNPRTITDKKLEMLKSSLAEFGDLGAIVFNLKSKQLVGGHQRIKLMSPDAEIIIERKFKKPTPVGTMAEGYVELDGERYKYREVWWDDVKEKAANIAANKGAGEWDMPELSTWLKEIDDFGFDLDLTMFDEDERTKVLMTKSPASTVEESDKDDELPPLPKKAKSKMGQLYKLGKHRLLCGDSTNASHLQKLFDKERADITFTSPPYNGNTHQMSGGKTLKLYENYDDNMPSNDYVKFASQVLTNSIEYSKLYVFWNVNYNSNSRCEYLKQIVPHLNLLDETIAWKKNGLPCPYGLTRVWEPIFVFKCHKDKKRISDLSTHETEFNFWDINNAGALHEQHRAAFPVALPGKALDLVKTAESLFDPFGGSGTSMIACEKRGKKCFMIELDPIYIDLIIERWETFTGKKAVLE